MTAQEIIAKLDGLKATGRDRWIAKCPAHDDKRPSLSIRELSDGRVLIHDFGGCSTVDVLHALGLAFEHLYPQDADQPKERRPFPAMDILRACATETLIAATSASNVAKGIAMSDDDRARLWQAAARLERAYEVANGQV